jgi:hypothetical protein
VCITKKTTLKGISVLCLQINKCRSVGQRFNTFEYAMYVWSLSTNLCALVFMSVWGPACVWVSGYGLSRRMSICFVCARFMCVHLCRHRHFLSLLYLSLSLCLCVSPCVFSCPCMWLCSILVASVHEFLCQYLCVFISVCICHACVLCWCGCVYNSLCMCPCFCVCAPVRVFVCLGLKLSCDTNTQTHMGRDMCGHTEKHSHRYLDTDAQTDTCTQTGTRGHRQKDIYGHTDICTWTGIWRDIAVIRFDELVGPGMPRLASSDRFFISGNTGCFGDHIENHTQKFG